MSGNVKSKSGPIVETFIGPVLKRAGIAGVLEVPNRRTGVPRRLTLVIYDMDGAEYVLSTFGIGVWVRDLRAAGRGRLTRRGKTREFIAVEVEPAVRDRVIAVYRARAPRPFQRDFDLRPDRADHPAFRLDPVPDAGPAEPAEPPTPPTAPPGT